MLLSLVVVAVLHAADARAEFDAWLDSPKSLALTDGRTAETLDLLAHTWVTAVEPRRGVPSFLWAERFPGARTPREQGLTATEAARQHLLRHAPLYRLSGALVAGLVVSEVHDLGKGAVIVGFARAHEGVPLLRDELDVVMTERYELVALTGSLATAPRPHGAFRLDAPSALAAAAQHLSGRFAEPSVFQPLTAHDGSWARFEPGPFFTTPPRARRVYFDDTDAVLPAWHLELETKGRLFAVVISAVDGRLLSRVNLEAHAAYTYTVWADPSAPFRPLDSPVGDVALPHPTSQPDAFNPPALAPVAVTLEHGGISTNDPWLPAGATELSGNNIHAYADLVAPDGLDGGDFTVAPSGANAFNFTYALTQNADAASTSARPRRRRPSSSPTGCTTPSTISASTRRRATGSATTSRAAGSAATRSTSRCTTTTAPTTPPCALPPTARRAACSSSSSMSRARARSPSPPPPTPTEASSPPRRRR